MNLVEYVNIEPGDIVILRPDISQHELARNTCTHLSEAEDFRLRTTGYIAKETYYDRSDQKIIVIRNNSSRKSFLEFRVQDKFLIKKASSFRGRGWGA